MQPQTILSTLWFVPVWFKYNATPYILRYLVYCVWTAVKAVYFRWHRAMVLRGAHLFSGPACPARTTGDTHGRSGVST